MGLFKNIAAFFDMPDASGIERKAFTTTQVGTLSDDAVADFLAGGGLDVPRAGRVSAVHACARVIAEGLALPKCYVKQQVGNKRSLATQHSVFSLLATAPNDRQTTYEFRDMLGWHLALDGNAYVFINRNARDGSILELLPVDPGKVSIQYDDSEIWNDPVYYFYGQRIPNDQVWHLKGPAWLNWRGMAAVREARQAIGLMSAAETYGHKLFENGARPAALITPAAGTTLTPDQSRLLKERMQSYAGAHNAHKTMVLNTALEVQMLSSRLLKKI